MDTIDAMRVFVAVVERNGFSAAAQALDLSTAAVTRQVAALEKRLSKDAKPDEVCAECSDDRKGKPILGLEIIRGAKKADDKDVWEGGKILDPENGRNYTLRMTPVEGGKKLEVRGSIGPFGRTQTWVRVQ